MKHIDIIKQHEYWAGCIDLDISDCGVTPWRARLADQSLYHDGFIARITVPAGVRLVLQSDTSSLRLEVSWTNYDDDPAYYDLVVDGEFFQRVECSKAQGTVLFSGIPKGDRTLEVYLPVTFGCVTVSGVAVDDEASVEPVVDRRPRWVTHGSSITMCRPSEFPTAAWPAIVAKQCGLNHINLGYGGQCKVETLVARYISATPADGISVCLGINVHSGDLSPRTFRPAAAGFLLTIRDGHPDVPLVVCSPIYSQPRETTPGTTGLSLQGIRDDLESLVSDLRDRGDNHIHYVSGLDLLGEADAHHMPDDLHPNREGCRVLADNFVRVVVPLLGFA